MTKSKYLLSILFLKFLLCEAVFAALPAVNITAPGTGDVFEMGEFVYFEGNATDPDDPGTPLTGTSLTWTSSRNGALGNGQSVTISNLDVGNHTIMLTAVDSNGETASDTILISVVNTPPTVTILSPENNKQFTVNNPVTFQGTALDPPGNNLTGQYLKWTSDIDGSLGTGSDFELSNLSPGTHTIKLTVTDPGGETTQASVTIEIINTKPVAVITSPPDNSVFTSQQTISFQGWGDDSEEPPIQDTTLRWVSSIDGEFGTGPLVNTDLLSPGTHTISLTVRDSSNLLSDPTTITIEITNQGPVPVISSPADNRIFNENENIVFTGSASDNEDGSITGAGLEWFSDIDGFLGTGTQLNNPNLSPGSHTITLTATDNDGLQNSVSISIVTGNKYPVPEITFPSDNSVFDEGDTIEFSGKATDYEDGAITGADLVWISSRDGQIGTGTTLVNPALSAGMHTITLKASDSYGAAGETSIIIIYGNVPPVAEILKPDRPTPPSTDYPEYEKGEDVILHGTGTDNEDGDLPPENLSWSSNLNGEITDLGTGTSFKVNTLKSGTHKITLTVKDSGNSKGTDEVTIIIKEMFPDKSLLSIIEGSNDTFLINGGIPPFSAFSRRSDVASASVTERTVTVTGKIKGESEIIITDKDAINSFSVTAQIFDSSVSFPSAVGFMTKDELKTYIASEGDNLVLDGSESSDSKGITEWNWEVENGNPPLYLADKSAEKSKFIAPPVSGNQKYTAILTVKNTDQVQSSDRFDFIIKEKNDIFDSEGIIPVESGEESMFYGIKYIRGLSQINSKKPGTDPRNRPAGFMYNLIDIEKYLDENETSAQLIIYLPTTASQNDKWYQENNAKGWQEMTASKTPLTNGAYFNTTRNQLFINIEDNGIYDLNPNEKIVRTVSGLGNNLVSDTKDKSSSTSSSSGSCFIDNLF